MAKEDYTTPLADEYILTHRPMDDRIEKWYEKYLPAGVTHIDISLEQEEKLIDIYSDCEIKAELYLKDVAKKKFDEHLKGMMDESLKKYLPLRPKIIWENLSVDQRTELTKIYKECTKKGENEKTIKKEIRKHFEEEMDEEKNQKLNAEDVQNMLEKWIDEKIKEKEYISKSEDYEDFRRIFGLAERTFSTRLRNSKLKFKKGKWMQE